MKNLLTKERKPIIENLGKAPLPTEFGDWTYMVYGIYAHSNYHEVLVFGNLEKDTFVNREDVLVRMHSACRTNEIFSAVNCECRRQLHQSMKLIKEEGEGIILYLDQEGRGNGIVGKLAQLNGMFGWKNGKIEQRLDLATGEPIDTDSAYRKAGYLSEIRDFTIAGKVLIDLGLTSVRLLTNNPKKIEAIINTGIKVTPVEIHIAPDNEIIALDLHSKAKNLGHNIKEEHWKIKNETRL